MHDKLCSYGTLFWEQFIGINTDFGSTDVVKMDCDCVTEVFAFRDGNSRNKLSGRFWRCSGSS